jgi:hypothetical protein
MARVKLRARTTPFLRRFCSRAGSGMAVFQTHQRKRRAQNARGTARFRRQVY